MWERRHEFLAINPAATTPVLVVEGHPPIPEAPIIAEFLDETQGEALGEHRLLPRDMAERIEVRRLCSWFTNKFYAEVSGPLVNERLLKRYMRAEQGGGSPDMESIRAGLFNIRYHLAYIGWLVRTRDWLAGDRLTYADLAAAAHLSSVGLSGRRTLARRRSRQGLVCARQVAALVPAAAGGRCMPACHLPRPMRIWISRARWQMGGNISPVRGALPLLAQRGEGREVRGVPAQRMPHERRSPLTPAPLPSGEREKAVLVTARDGSRLEGHAPAGPGLLNGPGLLTGEAPTPLKALVAALKAEAPDARLRRTAHLVRPDAVPLLTERLRIFLADGHHGDMGWLAADPQRRARARRCCGRMCAPSSWLTLNYGPGARSRARSLERRERGAISVYAKGDDYHDLIKTRLKVLAALADRARGRRR